MEVLRSYLNCQDQGKRISQILNIVPSRAISVNPRTKKHVRKQFDDSEVAQLLADYEAGVFMKDLVQKYQVHHVTIQKYVHRGRTKSRAHRASAFPTVEVKKLYLSGLPIVEIAHRLNASESTVSRALDRAGVVIRKRGRRLPRSTSK